MRKLFALLPALLLFAAAAPAQDLFSVFRGFAGRRVTFSFSLQYPAGTPVSGMVALQDNSFVLKTRDLELYSDGVSLWTVDLSGGEVVVSTGSLLSFKAFSDSVEVLDYSEKNGLEGTFMTPDGTKVRLSVAAFSFTEPVSPGDYACDMASLPPGFIVTDLR